MRFTTILASTAVMLTAVVVAMPLFGSGPTTSLASPSRSHETSVVDNFDGDNLNSSSLVKRMNRGNTPDPQCSVCLDNVKRKWNACKQSEKHKFCGRCIANLEVDVCPQCRGELREVYEMTSELCPTPPGVQWEPGTEWVDPEVGEQIRAAAAARDAAEAAARNAEQNQGQGGNAGAQQPQGGNGHNNGHRRGAAAGPVAGAGHGAQPGRRRRGRRGRANRPAVPEGGIRRSSRNRGNRGSSGSPSRGDRGGFMKRSESGLDHELQQRTEFYPEMHERMESDLGVQQRSEQYDAYMEEEDSSV